MTQPLPIRQQHGVLTGLQRAIAARNEAARQAKERYESALAEAQAQHDEALKQSAARGQAAATEAQREFDVQAKKLRQQFDTEHGPLEQQYRAERQKIDERFRRSKASTKKAMQDARFETSASFDATRHKPKREYLEAKKQVEARAQLLELVGTEARQYLADCRLLREPEVDPEGTPPPEDEDPLRAFVDHLAAAEKRLLELKAARLPRFFRNAGFFWVLIGIWLLVAAPVGWATDWHTSALVISGAVAVVLTGVVTGWLFLRARRQVRQLFDPLCQELIDAERARDRWHEQATAKFQREVEANKQHHEGELAKASENYNRAKAGATSHRDEALAALEGKLPARLAELKQNLSRGTADLEAARESRLAEIESQRATERTAIEAAFEQTSREAKATYSADWDKFAAEWRQNMQSVYGLAQQLDADIAARFPNWTTSDPSTWTLQHSVNPVVPVGRYKLDLDQMPGVVVNDPRLAIDVPHAFTLPALLSFPDRCSLVVKVAGSGRRAAIELLQTAMLRFMLAVPPGKTRFTIVDPVGLGQNFAGFMHLADYDEALVSHNILTEPQMIEQKLADLTAHMSTVIQKYLRNEYDTIEDYNEHAGEVAEPFRVLVVANFPFNFTEAAMRHLLSVASTGSRCGVHVLVSVDTKLAMPTSFRIADLEQHAIKLLWKEDRFIWKEEPFDKLQYEVEPPPPSDRFSSIVHLVGESAKDANRVEVPFEFIAPEASAYWTSNSSAGVDVPLGRAGATKRQNLKLGRGTAQHVLIAGKTGSGKSTLLHALITNLALMYSPDEIELYLIDFKKGVEFKTYAQHRLPHARVIAIESEREFGLSVLQRLDAELKYRGDRFRDLNVPDLASFRQLNGSTRMPRILLIVDEFQEFFVEDDKIAQDVALLLDRLVRQGRAFGIHVNLGSQTLGGAYGLARTTLGQMAVRIALQCSEADANLILSEENPAARLLSRPGEAIYNDANGRSEGNNLFQVVWLTDDRHDSYLQTVRDMADQRQVQTPPQIIFEGNVPADIAKNPMLEPLLAADTWPAPPKAAMAWLGEAIAIKDPTVALFRRQSGSNMILLGQQSEPALAMCVSTIFSLAAQHPPASDDGAGGAKFYVLDGSSPDSPQAGVLGKIAATLPHSVEVVPMRKAGEAIAELSAEMERRQGTHEGEPAAIYVFIYDLPRFRDLRKAEDDFGFSREEKANPAKQLVALLREGPPLGIHFICWCDTLNNLHRTFERQTLREFETRVLFQMSVSDSSSLVDSPVASKLGPHRALLHSEEQGRLEKFRPYSLPPDEWLGQAVESLRRRSGEPTTAKGG